MPMPQRDKRHHIQTGWVLCLIACILIVVNWATAHPRGDEAKIRSAIEHLVLFVAAIGIAVALTFYFTYADNDKRRRPDADDDDDDDDQYHRTRYRRQHTQPLPRQSPPVSRADDNQMICEHCFIRFELTTQPPGSRIACPGCRKPFTVP
jgi:hypothetical protein